METIFINTENGKTNESTKFICQFTEKLNLKTSNNKNIGLVNLSIYYIWKNTKSAYNNKFKISAPTCNDEFECLMDHILLQTKSSKTISFLKYRQDTN